MTDYRTLGERALDVLTTLTGSAQIARSVSQGLGARGALGELGYYHTFGGLWGRTELSRRDRSLVVISINAAFERGTELDFHMHGGLNHGLRTEELDELVITVSTYAGAPAGVNASGVLDQVIAKREGGAKRSTPPPGLELKDEARRRADGLDVLRTLLAHLRLDPKQLEARLMGMGFMGEMALDWAFGEVWSRPGLSRRDRSIVVVSVLAALNLVHELEIHLQGALNHGVTRVELEEIMVTLAGYGGFPRAIDAMIVARRVFEGAGASPGR
jgi:4-carboxymuconolactone decarboxylase